ncbi:MAG: F0F1 ATP synthase subunit epsilon [Parcubacteria group bacterium GW2011_GWA2_31_28]|nr:MAG: F0F1 ATP synthase subunit epsilon [Parcubacteria group bacterium GW2011_GWA2_31_28]
MQLSILALDKILFKGEAKSLSVPSSNGILQILDNHIPLLTSLKKGILKIQEKGKKEFVFEVHRGILDVRNNSKVIVLLR